MPEVEREAERVRVPEPPVQRLEVHEPLHEHPRLRLEAEPDPAPLGVRDDARDALEQPVPRGAGLHARRDGAGPERDDGRLELHGDVDRARELAHAALAALGEQRRVVLAARVEREAGAGLDHARELELVEQPPQRRGAAAHARRVGVEVDVVERERDAAVAAVGEQPDGVLEPVAGQPVA